MDGQIFGEGVSISSQPYEIFSWRRLHEVHPIFWRTFTMSYRLTARYMGLFIALIASCPVEAQENLIHVQVDGLAMTKVRFGVHFFLLPAIFPNTPIRQLPAARY